MYMCDVCAVEKNKRMSESEKAVKRHKLNYTPHTPTCKMLFSALIMVK